MKSSLAFAAMAMALGSALAQQQNQVAPAQPGAAAAASAAQARVKRDPLAYFTDTELFTQDGRKLRFYSDVLKGRTVVMNTIYTNCSDACPLITQAMNAVRARLVPAFGKDIFFVTLTTDPLRDTPQAMKAYAAKQSADVPGWIFLTGKQADVERVLRRIGQWSENVESHSTQLVAWNFNTERGRKFLPNLPPEALAAQITMLADGESLLPLPAINAAKPQ